MTQSLRFLPAKHQPRRLATTQTEPSSPAASPVFLYSVIWNWFQPATILLYSHPSIITECISARCETSSLQLGYAVDLSHCNGAHHEESVDYVVRRDHLCFMPGMVLEQEAERVGLAPPIVSSWPGLPTCAVKHLKRLPAIQGRFVENARQPINPLEVRVTPTASVMTAQLPLDKTFLIAAWAEVCTSTASYISHLLTIVSRPSHMVRTSLHIVFIVIIDIF